MRKVLLTILATAVLAGCSKDDVIKRLPQQEIAFGNVFVDNSTKADDPSDPSYTADNLEQFFVYGNITGNKNTANIYSGAEVSKSSGVWNCGVTQYWIADCTYDFVAVSNVGFKKDGVGDELVTVTTHTTPATVAGLPSAITYDATCQKDLLYAEYKNVETNASAIPDKPGVENGIVKPIPFSFSHLLSKVKFTFTNSFSSNSGVVLTVTDIKITDAAKKGTYNISNETWDISESYTESVPLDCGSSSEMSPAESSENSKYCLLVPNTQDITITFTVSNSMNSNVNTLSSVITDLTLEPGMFYNFTADLSPQNIQGVVPISFTINKGDWIATDGEDNDDNKDIEVGPRYNINVTE